MKSSYSYTSAVWQHAVFGKVLPIWFSSLWVLTGGQYQWAHFVLLNIYYRDMLVQRVTWASSRDAFSLLSASWAVSSVTEVSTVWARSWAERSRVFCSWTCLCRLSWACLLLSDWFLSLSVNCVTFKTHIYRTCYELIIVKWNRPYIWPIYEAIFFYLLCRF